MHQHTEKQDREVQAVPEILYKIVTVEHWEKSQAGDRLVLAEGDQAFVHLSMEHQVQGVLEKKFVATPSIVLKVRTAELEGDIVLEWNSKGTEQFYHLYRGHIPLNAVEIDHWKS